MPCVAVCVSVRDPCLCAPAPGELRWLVLDEADRLLDLGFEAKLKEVVDALDKAAAQAHGEVGVARSGLLGSRGGGREGRNRRVLVERGGVWFRAASLVGRGGGCSVWVWVSGDVVMAVCMRW